MATMYEASTKSSSLIKNEVAQIAIGLGILFCCAQISIPLQPVPITLQTIAVMLIGLFYSQKTAIKTVLSYLVLGAFGAPVFASFHGGILTLVGPTGGYLIGFLLAASAMSCARERIVKETWVSTLCNCVLGTTLIFLCGITWLSFYVGLNQAIQLGFLPFIIPECIKAAILSVAVRSIKNDQ